MHSEEEKEEEEDLRPEKNLEASVTNRMGRGSGMTPDGSGGARGLALEMESPFWAWECLRARGNHAREGTLSWGLRPFIAEPLPLKL